MEGKVPNERRPSPRKRGLLLVLGERILFFARPRRAPLEEGQGRGGNRRKERGLCRKKELRLLSVRGLIPFSEVYQEKAFNGSGERGRGEGVKDRVRGDFLEVRRHLLPLYQKKEGGEGDNEAGGVSRGTIPLPRSPKRHNWKSRRRKKVWGSRSLSRASPGIPHESQRLSNLDRRDRGRTGLCKKREA